MLWESACPLLTGTPKITFADKSPIFLEMNGYRFHALPSG